MRDSTKNMTRPATPTPLAEENESQSSAPDFEGKTIVRAAQCCGVIGATVRETRIRGGGRRYSVLFRRDIGDLSLEGSFGLTFGQEELLDIIFAASWAYQEINDLRRMRRLSPVHERTYGELLPEDGWSPDDDGDFFAEQIEP